MADWEQQVWLCKSEVSVFLSLLSLAAPHSQKYRNSTVKSTIRNRRRSAVPAWSQFDIQRGVWTATWTLEMNSFVPLSIHLNVIQLVPFSLKWSLGLICCEFLSMCVCVCVRVQVYALWANSLGCWMDPVRCWLPQACYHGDPLWESIIVIWQGWSPPVDVLRGRRKWLVILQKYI